MPESLLSNCLMEKLNARFQAEIAVPPYRLQKDERTNLLNPHSIREFSLRLADEVEKAIKNNLFPLVLGGDCRILLGNVLALKRLGHYGLSFLGGHADSTCRSNRKSAALPEWIWLLQPAEAIAF